MKTNSIKIIKLKTDLPGFPKDSIIKFEHGHYFIDSKEFPLPIPDKIEPSNKFYKIIELFDINVKIGDYIQINEKASRYYKRIKPTSILTVITINHNTNSIIADLNGVKIILKHDQFKKAIPYYFISSKGIIQKAIIEQDTKSYEFRKITNNIFDTKEEAITVLNNLTKNLNLTENLIIN